MTDVKPTSKSSSKVTAKPAKNSTVDSSINAPKLNTKSASSAARDLATLDSTSPTVATESKAVHTSRAPTQSATSKSNQLVTTRNVSTTLELKVNDAFSNVPITIEGKFEWFPKLPPELRIKIWKLVPESRIVEIRFPRDGRKNTHRFFASFPAILHSCRESRREGLKQYHRAFDSKWALNGVYFNYEIDILYYSLWSDRTQKKFFARRIKAKDLVKIERIALLPWDLETTVGYQGLKELIYLEPHFDNYFARHAQLSTCSMQGPVPAFHSCEEVSKLKDEQVSHQVLGAKSDFNQFKARFDKGDQGSTVALTHRLLCRRGYNAAYLD
ncbi:hypothetical protein N431DRAFT_472673 [Stipitochalara longipes BDJ]|nr:hypothetical protein N431DRAFT_472673 [Stipitochalara longipes BDJ]